ncbi:pimeloyl-ACP methyl ester carboxylesterase [Kribbella aluminosa]|uniref:Pimeloyl-ACP methyl ester carboxylesterase n=1 Tax=Kribbella aluminosa TaxID=416017 RepID=A0ABS4UWP9_9ACTN|nr:alpha/beta fold hydrolase [Kribbella aluminosa]MBP2356057.1 pimeloyl-ACP methyl ester carboxylesterase [Kribbella aluminosa]
MLTLNAVLINEQTASAAPTGTVQIDGTALYVQQVGPATAPTLVLIHGLGSSTHVWDAVAPTLAKSHHVVLVDLLGHGRSAKPVGDQYSIANQARLAGDVLVKLGVTHAVVVGPSTGGSVATALAEQRTDSILRKAASSAFSRPGFKISQQMIEDVHGMTYQALTATSRASDDFIKQ